MTLFAVFDDGRRAAGTAASFGHVDREKAARLLVIDDAVVHRMIICKLAVKAGLIPFEAEDRGDVARLTATRSFACATLDLALGERAVTEVLRHFSLRGFRAPIIILSGAVPEVTRGAFERGKSLHLNMLEPINKPVDLAELRGRFVTIAAEGQRNRWQEPVPS
jgi:CheY-like chemotaxis protein